MKKILVIEDEADIRESIVDILDLSNYVCIEAANGVQGVREARSSFPDLIICDVMMPELDGYGVLLELQNDTQTAMIPFLFLTAMAAHEDVRKGMALGADDYLVKPFTGDELLTTVAKRLEKYDLLSRTRKADDLRLYLNVSLPHELRTPLTGIIGYLELLMSDYENIDPGTIQIMLRRMSVSTNRLYRLVENYLLYSRLVLTQQDDVVVEKLQQYSECYNPDELIEQAAQQQSMAHKRPDDLHLGEVSRATISVYAENFTKIMNELVDNAFKFSQAGTPVMIETGVSNDSYSVTISDQGRGMTQDQITFIAANQQFNREKYEQQGSGLGLVLSKQIVALFGGEITIQSVPDHETIVVVTLPLC